ncbi:hypothetical protein LX36DRAFT_423153 [Colletotrichum falcatum]|nr:hypothetical protein LX36DRAFT_423153 [Colletotrichum falcatum]
MSICLGIIRPDETLFSPVSPKARTPGSDSARICVKCGDQASLYSTWHLHGDYRPSLAVFSIHFGSISMLAAVVLLR